ncbi:MAG: hypothetical protein IJE83_04065 [Oscillospiraceae bacterium]|nr:hypothetical protein [Oscillospiraceae bacterium]MBQ2795749.1 hypothetical protein [Oscillospiraceae bacterium]MBQ2861947.1 hypothetical protein [Oscillospiraceae bacterium]MBQ2998617.1 hypothetical protein [Oscillospiraceae bacterium]MBQ3236825.1 hypothetical protein [Oscillospiraceae bacterium]
MKKMLAVILGLMLIMLSVTGCARPDPTYVTAEDFDVEFYPMSEDGKVFAAGLTAIQIVMNTPNVEMGTGELQIFKSSNDERIARYDARMDTDYIFLNSGTNPAYAQLIIFLPEGQYFEAGESYYVTVDEKFFYVDDIKDFIGGIEKGEWEFTIGNYGYNGDINELPITYLVGDEIEIPVSVADEAALAILNYDNVSVVSAEKRALTENGTFTLECVQAGTATISIMFLDEDGMHIETLGFTVTVK